MAIRYLNCKFILLCISICSIGIGCIKPQPCWREYEFNFPATITPALGSFLIGDTIWYEIEFSNRIVDEITGESVDITGLDLTHFKFTIERFDTIHLTAVGNNFDYFVTEGSFEQTSSGGELYLDRSGVNYIFRMYFIPQKKGGYTFSGRLPTYYADEELRIFLDDPCFASVFKQSRIMPNNENIDFSVFDGRYTLIQTQTGIDTFFWDKIEDPQRYGSYAFWVN